MKNRINKVRRDLRALKKSSHALQRLIEIRGIHYRRIDLLKSLPQSEERAELIVREKELISALCIEQQIKENEEMENEYMQAIAALSPVDKAMALDCFVNGMPYRRLAMEYGLSEEGARKRISAIIKRIASTIE